MSDEDLTSVAAAAPSAPPVAISASAEYNCYDFGSEQLCWAVTNFKAPYYEPTSRVPIDIVAVIDKSGSMRETKLNLVKKTLLFVIDQLKDCDRFSLVTYDTEVNLIFELMKMDAVNRSRAKAFAESIECGSSTNLCGGLIKGMEQIALTSDGEKAQVQSVLLLTDGLANCGTTTEEDIVAEIKNKQDHGIGAVSGGAAKMPPHIPCAAQVPPPSRRDSFFKRLFRSNAPQQEAKKTKQQDEKQTPGSEKTDVKPNEDDCKKFDGTVYTFGFGSDHDSHMLEAISTQGGGVYYYIDSNEKIPESFADCLGGLLSLMGQNLSLKLDAIEGNTFKTVHANRTINWNTPNKSCEIPMGDLQSEEERDIVLELMLPALPGPVEKDLVVKAELSYFNIITSQLETVKCQLLINRTDGEKGPGNMAVDIQRNRIVATSALKTATGLAKEGQLLNAQAELKRAIATLEESISRGENLTKVLVSDLKKSLGSMETAEAYDSYGELYITSRMQSHCTQRSNYVDEFDAYQNSSKLGYRSRSKQ